MKKLRVLIAMTMIAGATSMISCEETEMNDLSPLMDMPDAQMTNGNAHSDPNKPPKPGDD